MRKNEKIAATVMLLGFPVGYIALMGGPHPQFHWGDALVGVWFGWLTAGVYEVWHS